MFIFNCLGRRARLLGGMVGLLAAVLPWSARAQSLGFDEALQLGLARSALLQARSTSVRGATALQTSAGQLPDPKLTLGLDSLPINTANRFSLTRDDFTERQIGWMQEVPNRDKRQARTDAALARTGQAQALLVAERLNVQRDAGLAWLARFFAERRLARFAALEEDHRLLLQTADARASSGKASLADALAARQETLALADRRDELQRELAKAQAALQRWLGSAASRPLAESPPALALDADYLLQHLDRHAELARYRPLLEMAQAEAREAEAAKKGDWAWGVGYAKRGPAYADFVSFQLTFELPVDTAQRQDPQVAAKRSEVTRIESELEDMQRGHREEIQAQAAQDRELSAKRTRLNDQALPLADQRVALALAAYEGARADLGALITARKDRLELQLRALELEAQQLALRLRLNTYFSEETP